MLFNFEYVNVYFLYLVKSVCDLCARVGEKAVMGRRREERSDAGGEEDADENLGFRSGV